MNIVLFYYKYFRFIVLFIEYIFFFVGKICLKDFKKFFSEFKWEKGYRVIGVE